jgi:hypothetical protein
MDRLIEGSKSTVLSRLHDSPEPSRGTKKTKPKPDRSETGGITCDDRTCGRLTMKISGSQPNTDGRTKPWNPCVFYYYIYIYIYIYNKIIIIYIRYRYRYRLLGIDIDIDTFWNRGNIFYLCLSSVIFVILPPYSNKCILCCYRYRVEF